MFAVSGWLCRSVLFGVGMPNIRSTDVKRHESVTDVILEDGLVPSFSSQSRLFSDHVTGNEFINCIIQTVNSFPVT